MLHTGDNESDGWGIGVYKVFISGRIGERDLPDHLDLSQKVADDGVSFSSMARVQSLTASLDNKMTG